MEGPEVRVGDLVRHKEQMELEAMVIFKTPMNVYVLVGTESKAVCTSH